MEHLMREYPDARSGRDMAIMVRTDQGPVTMRIVCDPRRFTSSGSQGFCQCGKAVKRSRGQIRRHARLLSSE